SVSAFGQKSSKLSVFLKKKGSETQVLNQSHLRNDGTKQYLDYIDKTGISYIHLDREVYEYYPDGAVKSITYLSAPRQGSDYLPDDKYEYTYDANGFISSEIDYDIIQGRLVPDEKEEYTNDEFGNPLITTNYDWVGNAYVQDYKMELVKQGNKYVGSVMELENGQPITYPVELEILEANEGRWKIFTMTSRNEKIKIEKDWDQWGNVILFQKSEWHERFQTWLVDEFEEYRYDNFGNLIFNESYDADDENGDGVITENEKDWDGDKVEFSTFDASGYPTEGIEYEQSERRGNWRETQSWKLYYRSSPTFIRPLTDITMNYWTENNQLYIQAQEAGSIKVYNTNGQIIEQLQVEAGINTLDLYQGLYIVVIDEQAFKVKI
ncbi:MAG: T9SS type A sorting domain-containing protein, partial [Bacteroidales bacterium]|nr:T9SS type A sorting domain-containing protein [Bacteroidales bacterium]